MVFGEVTDQSDRYESDDIYDIIVGLAMSDSSSSSPLATSIPTVSSSSFSFNKISSHILFGSNFSIMHLCRVYSRRKNASLNFCALS